MHFLCVYNQYTQYKRIKMSTRLLLSRVIVASRIRPVISLLSVEPVNCDVCLRKRPPTYFALGAIRAMT